MTDIGVFRQDLFAEDLSWDLTRDPDNGHDGGGTLAVAAFDQTQHFPHGFIPSGTLLGQFTSGPNNGLLGPYLDTATDGRQKAGGLLKASVQVVQPNGQLKTNVGCAVRKAFVAVRVSRLPFTSGTAALGGFLDTDARADLPLIYFDDAA